MEPTSLLLPEADTERTEQEAEHKAPAQYGTYSPEQLGFDPMKDLNLPGSYEEVVKRFKRLQGAQTEEVLN